MVQTTKELNEEKNKNPFGWYSAIVTIAGEDILKMPEVVKIHHIEVFNYLTFTIDLNNKREREFKQNVKL